MFEKGQICTVEIMDMSDQGQGIGRADGMAVFVPDTVVGDLARVQLTKVKKSYAFAKHGRRDYQEGRNCGSGRRSSGGLFSRKEP